MHWKFYKEMTSKKLPCNLGVLSLLATVLQLVFPTMYRAVKDKLLTLLLRLAVHK